MSGLDLRPAQRRILTTLVDRYQSEGEPVRSDRIADVIDRTPNTVRHQMQSLSTLGLVEGTRGPHGGYEPTDAALDLLDRSLDDEIESVTVASGFDRLSATVAEIDFVNVNHPDECRAHVQVRETLEGVDPGDAVVVGPTPVGDLAVAGTVEAVDHADAALYLDVARLEAPVTRPE